MSDSLVNGSFGSNGDNEWRNLMAPLDPLDGDTQSVITIQSEWIIWRSNGAN